MENINLNMEEIIVRIDDLVNMCEELKDRLVQLLETEHNK